MNDLKRLEVKYVRDGIKNLYRKADSCDICGTSENLQYHHYNSMDLLWTRWKLANKVSPPASAEEIKSLRQLFYKDNWNEVVEDCATLCSMHHKMLHNIYGATPPLATANKQKAWVVLRNARETKNSA